MAQIKNVDTEMFDRTMLKYIKVAKRTLPEVLNTKGYWVARNAIRLTHKASKDKIRYFTDNWKRSSSTIIKMFKLQGKKFKPKTYQTKLKKFRTRSIGYLRSGWIPALRALGGWAKQSRTYKGVRMKGRQKGKVKMAKKTWSSHCTITSMVGHSRHQAKAAKKYVKPALQKAMNREAQEMAKYILKKYKEAAKKAGIKRVK